MRKLTVLLLLTAAQSYAAIAYVNSVRCASATSCATTWSVTAGNVLVVGRWGSGEGTISDNQSNTYTQIESAAMDSYATSHIHATILASGGSTVTVTSTVTETNIVLVEFSGVMLTVDTHADGSNNQYMCPPSAPLSITTSVPALILSIWSDYAQGPLSCVSTSGTLAATSQCGGSGTGQLRYQIAAAGTYTQQFTFNPSYNAGNTVCGMYALKGMTSTAKVNRRVITQ
jgi:hypothetical protein